MLNARFVVRSNARAASTHADFETDPRDAFESRNRRCGNERPPSPEPDTLHAAPLALPSIMEQQRRPRGRIRRQAPVAAVGSSQADAAAAVGTKAAVVPRRLRAPKPSAEGDMGWAPSWLTVGTAALLTLSVRDRRRLFTRVPPWGARPAGSEAVAAPTAAGRL